jgi:hypothetical protein
MTAVHPEIGTLVAQRACARTRDNIWKVYGRTDDLTDSPDPRPLLVLQNGVHLDRLWSVGLSAEGFWEEFVRLP